MSSIVNQTPYLRTSREFPVDAAMLSNEVDKSYLDIANAVNSRTIGIYAVNRQVVTGNSFFITNQKQQSIRQLYGFGSIAAGGSLSVPIKNYTPPYVSIIGMCQTDFPDSRPIPYASVAANSNIGVRIDSVTKTIVISNGAASPNIISGTIILEWMSAV